MENMRYLLAAVAALTLIMSVVSGVNPGYFSGLNAFADNDDEEEDSDNSGSRSNDDNDEDEQEDDEEHEDDDQDDDDSEDDDDDNDNDKAEEKIVKSLGNHSNVALEIDDDVELKVEIEDGDLDNGTYNVTFACESPDIDDNFADALKVENGAGEFEEDLSLANGTYSGCEVNVGDLSAIFDSFTVATNEEDDDEDEDEEDDETHGDRGSSNGSNDDEDEEDDDDNGKGSHREDSTDDKRKERKERIVNSTSGDEIHERHRSENAASPGVYKLGWNYTLEANGTAIHDVHNDTLDHQADATINIDLAVWKSSRAIILLDVVGGSIVVENQTYTVVIGYSIYSVQHDAIRVAALAVDDEGNVFKLKMRGSAVDEEAEFPIESGSVDLTFEGSSGPLNNSFGDWKLTMDGSVKSS